MTKSWIQVGQEPEPYPSFPYQLQPCDVPHSVQTPQAPALITFVVPQFKQLTSMYMFPNASRTRSACVLGWPLLIGLGVPSEFERLVITSMISFSAVRGNSATGRLVAFFSISAISFIWRSGCDRPGAVASL